MIRTARLREQGDSVSRREKGKETRYLKHSLVPPISWPLIELCHNIFQRSTIIFTRPYNVGPRDQLLNCHLIMLRDQWVSIFVRLVNTLLQLYYASCSLAPSFVSLAMSVFVCLSVCLYGCMSQTACLYLCLSACLHVCMSACLHVCMSACLHV